MRVILLIVLGVPALFVAVSLLVSVLSDLYAEGPASTRWCEHRLTLLERALEANGDEAELAAAFERVALRCKGLADRLSAFDSKRDRYRAWMRAKPKD